MGPEMEKKPCVDFRHFSILIPGLEDMLGVVLGELLSNTIN
jgi:hypothetical protein